MTTPSNVLTEAEEHALDLLADAWIAYKHLPTLHPSSATEFCQAIHAAQNIILARLALRQLNQFTPFIPQEAPND